MSFFIRSVFGDDERDPPLERLEKLYAEKDDGDEEHFGVSVIHETEWCLTLQPNNTLIWENLEDGSNPRHLDNVTKEKVLELWTKLTRDEIEEIHKEPWLEGYY